MNNVHGLIYANHTFPGLEALGSHRTGASLPFCGRYRLIDFALSGMMNAGVRNLGVIMQKGYQSLMEHLGNGRSWDLSRHSGGLHLLPPYGMPDADKGFYDGCMEALGAVYTYLKDIREDYVLIARGDLCANVNMRALIEDHLASGADITTVCTRENPAYVHHSFVTDADGYVTELLCCQQGEGRGDTGLEMYILHREKLLELVRWCRETSRLHFHSDALNYALRNGWRIKTCLHEGYAVHITNVRDYYRANMDMLNPEKRASVFPRERYVATRACSDTSTYYSDTAKVKNSLIADGCRIEGSVENCVLFGGVTVKPGAVLKNCIVLNDTVIGEDSCLKYVISDKNVHVSSYIDLSGNEKLPIVIPKGSEI